MKSKAKKKSRVTSLSVLQSIERTVGAIDRKVGTIAKFVEPVTVAGAEHPLEFGIDLAVRFIKLDQDGKPLPASAKAWAAVRDTKLDLDWSAEDIGAAMPHAAAKDAVAKLTLCGAKNWRLPTVEELFLLADRSRREPAIDIAFFPTCKSAWYWSSTPSAGGSDYSWIVHFSGGGSYWDSHDGHSLVRACRPSQS